MFLEVIYTSAFISRSVAMFRDCRILGVFVLTWVTVLGQGIIGDHLIIVNSNGFTFSRTDLDFSNKKIYSTSFSHSPTNFIAVDQVRNTSYIFLSEYFTYLQIYPFNENGVTEDRKSFNFASNFSDVSSNLKFDRIYIAVKNIIKVLSFEPFAVNREIPLNVDQTIRALQVDPENKILHCMPCDATNCFIKRYNLTTDSVVDNGTLVDSFDAIEFDFETREIYASKGRFLSKANMTSLVFTPIFEATSKILSFALSPNNIYLAIQNFGAIKKVDRKSLLSSDSPDNSVNPLAIAVLRGENIQTTVFDQTTPMLTETLPPHAATDYSRTSQTTLPHTQQSQTNSSWPFKNQPSSTPIGFSKSPDSNSSLTQSPRTQFSRTRIPQTTEINFTHFQVSHSQAQTTLPNSSQIQPNHTSPTQRLPQTNRTHPSQTNFSTTPGPLAQSPQASISQTQGTQPPDPQTNQTQSTEKLSTGGIGGAPTCLSYAYFRPGLGLLVVVLAQKLLRTR